MWLALCLFIVMIMLTRDMIDKRRAEIVLMSSAHVAYERIQVWKRQHKNNTFTDYIRYFAVWMLFSDACFV